MSSDINPEDLSLPIWYLSDVALNNLAAHRSVPDSMLRTLTAKADSLLDIRPESVMEKKKEPPTGDKHDYMSLAIYTWPDPDAPDGLPYIHKDGLVNPEIHDYDLPRFGRLTGRTEILVLAALHSGKTVYADKASQLLRTWFLDEATRMNPHLNFGQGVPGECDGRCYGIIETTGLIRVVNAVRILEKLDGYGYGDGPAMREWFRSYARWLQTSEIGIGEANTINNHRIWYTAQLTAYLLFCDESQAAGDVLRKMVPDILATQMEPDGSLPRELGRTRSSHYVTFALIPLLMCVDMGRSLDLNLAGMKLGNGVSVKKGIDWYLPYLAGEKEWTWQQIIDENPVEDSFPILRMAANVLNEPVYEEVLKDVAGVEYADLPVNLVIPTV